MNGNDFMSWVLRSPFHGMLSDGMMIMTVTGRKTGKKFTFPVGYYPEDGCLWVITSRDRTWWKNLRYYASGEATWSDGENTTIEPRPEHKIKDAPALLKMVRFCVSQTGASVFPEDEQHIAAYLNQQFYKFK